MVWSLRNKQLAFFAALISIISAISFYSQHRLSILLDEFQSNLDNYFAINRYLIDLKSLRSSMNGFIRESSLENLQLAMSAKNQLNVSFAIVERQPETSLEAYFLLRGLRNGQEVSIEKYLEAIEQKQRGESNFYLPYHTADRIVEYLEGYTTSLLSIRLSEGNESYQELTQRVSYARTLILFLLGMISLICIGFALVFTNSLTGPIQRLAGAAERIAGGDLDAPLVPIRTKDEIWVLSTSFNRMKENIRKMFQDLQDKAEIEKRLHTEELRNVDMQRTLKEAQFLNLQSQIKPHFLFNTLNLLARHADFERADRTAELVRSLSHLFRYSFKKHGFHVSLQEELDFIEEYLRIETQRFGNRIRYVRRSSLDSQCILLPAFTLEPLVENALFYGLEPKEEGGVLRIKITTFKNRLRIRILDTGLGMETRTLEGVRNGHKGWIENGPGIGIKNVRERLNIFFDAKEEFRIYSKKDRGTLVWISFPITDNRDMRPNGV